MGKTTKNAGIDTRGAGRWSLMAVAVLVALLAACTTGPAGSGSLGQIKGSHYGQLAQQDAAGVAANTKQSIVEFTVEDTPPSIFVNYVVPDAQAAAFESFIDLPPAFSLAKVRILESDPVPQYWLSLNVYRVSGITNGVRAEWSTYVDDGTGTPRFMIIRARAADGSIDPIGPLAHPEPFQHVLDSGVITTAMKRTEIQNGVPVLTPDNLFSSTIELPDPVDRNYVSPTRQWVAANDFIYWINGVNDRTFQNATAHSAPLISVDLADVTVDDESPWVPYIDPAAAHVLVYLDKIQFTISPWWNVTAPDGRVDPAILAARIPFKVNLYSGLANTRAIQVQTGTGQAEVQSTIEGTPPSVDWHWRVPAANLATFEASLGLPPGLALTTVPLEEGEAADYWLSLNVHKVSGDAATGLRAEWSTYVDDGKGEGPRNLIIEARADHSALDPVNRFTDPYPLTHSVVASSVNTDVGSGVTTFSSSFVVPPAGSAATILAAREWVGANELRYWTNGVADRITHDSNVFNPKVSIDPATVSMTDGGPWAAFVGGSPDRVWVTEDAVGLVTNPWVNVNG